ncbi:hypothetical protein MBLNU457_1390t2 [Dothideomycetes sp. NU457]
MQSIKQVQRLNEAELEKAVPPSASWHTDYRDTAYIYIGGLPFDLSEGDIIAIFSQYGDPVWIKLARDKDTGKSRGFAWLKYEDQRSCDLAVDNLSGATVMGRMLAIDHTRYKKRDDEDEMEGYVGQAKLGPDKDEGTGKRRRVDAPEESESEEERRPMIKEEIELAKMLEAHDEEDPMKAYMIQSKKEEVEEALKGLSKSSKGDRHHRHRHHRSRRDDDRGESRRKRRSPSVDSRDGRRDRHRSHRDRSASPRPKERESRRRDYTPERRSRDHR